VSRPTAARGYHPYSYVHNSAAALHRPLGASKSKSWTGCGGGACITNTIDYRNLGGILMGGVRRQRQRHQPDHRVENDALAGYGPKATGKAPTLGAAAASAPPAAASAVCGRRRVEVVVVAAAAAPPPRRIYCR